MHFNIRFLIFLFFLIANLWLPSEAPPKKSSQVKPGAPPQTTWYVDPLSYLTSSHTGVQRTQSLPALGVSDHPLRRAKSLPLVTTVESVYTEQEELNILAKDGMPITDPLLWKKLVKFGIKRIKILPLQDYTPSESANIVTLLERSARKWGIRVQYTDILYEFDGNTARPVLREIRKTLTGSKKGDLVVCMGGDDKTIEAVQDGLSPEVLVAFLSDENELVLQSFPSATPKVVDHIIKRVNEAPDFLRPKLFVSLFQVHLVEAFTSEFDGVVMPLAPPKGEEGKAAKDFEKLFEQMVRHGMTLHLLAPKKLFKGSENVEGVLQANRLFPDTITETNQPIAQKLEDIMKSASLPKRKMVLISSKKKDVEDARKLGFLAVPVPGKGGFDFEKLQSSWPASSKGKKLRF